MAALLVVGGVVVSLITSGSPTEARLHARLAPSAAFQWAADDGCRGAPAMQERYPEDEASPTAAEGTAAHWYVSETLQHRAVTVGKEAPNKVPVTTEMVDCGNAFVADVWRVARRNASQGVLHVEQPVRIATVHPDCWGTPDAYVINRSERTIHLWDYKYGHRFVDAYRNWQLLLYAIGVLETAGIPQDDWKHWSITLTIVQPRNYHPAGPVREWVLGGPALLKYVEPLQRAAIEASVAGAKLRTGDHCRDCTARHACPALLRSAALSVDIAHEQTPMEMTPAGLGLELRYLTAALARIKARHDALEEQALGLIRSGRDVPLWKGDYSNGREGWKRPAAELVAMGDLMGVDLRKPVECITPNQARKAGVDDAVVRAFSERPRGSLRLVPVNDDTVSRAFQKGDEL
jgi:hypothetical protein